MELGVFGWLRWMWRQLTSMRVAIMLLLLLAVAALPGSIIPQVTQDPSGVAQYYQDSPRLAEWLDRLGFFDVYASPWFGAVYLLLFVSLIGCIVPRTAVHFRALRAAPPKVPSRLSRFPVRREATVEGSRSSVEASLVAALRRGPLGLPRYRTTVSAEGISAERGYLRETGNIVFHLSLVALLLIFGLGQVLSYRGQAIVIEGQSFANSVVDYDSFEAGRFFDSSSLEPFTFTLEEFRSEFTPDAQARDFVADLTVYEPDGSVREEMLEVNHPVGAAGARVYLSGNGFAPVITVEDGSGEVAFSGAVPFLPEDFVYTSRGVIKVPDVSSGQEQLGLTGALLPTAVVEGDGSGARSLHPQPNNPLLVLTLWAGDLGLDTGIPQNVYVLDTDEMRQVYEAQPDGTPGSAESGQRPVTIFLEPGATVELPEGLGTITWEGLPRFAALDLRYDPTMPYLLAAAILSMVGLFASLFTARRRLWVRMDEQGESVRIEAAALARGDDAGLAKDLDRALAALGIEPPDEERHQP